MVDVFDKVSELEDKEKESRIQQIRAVANRRELTPRGTCHFCQEVTKPEQVFCDSDCATDHERLKKNKR